MGPLTGTTDDQVPPRAGRREWIGLAVIALACVLSRGRRAHAVRDDTAQLEGAVAAPTDA